MSSITPDSILYSTQGGKGPRISFFLYGIYIQCVIEVVRGLIVLKSPTKAMVDPEHFQTFRAPMWRNYKRIQQTRYGQKVYLTTCCKNAHLYTWSNYPGKAEIGILGVACSEYSGVWYGEFYHSMFVLYTPKMQERETNLSFSTWYGNTSFKVIDNMFRLKNNPICCSPTHLNVPNVPSELPSEGAEHWDIAESCTSWKTIWLTATDETFLSLC